MNPVLAELITSFRSAQDRAVKFIAGGFGGVLSVRLPVSNCDWLSCVSDSGLHAVESINHIPIDAHGFGIFIEFPDLTIDFDWGQNGEPDGFDAWRLWFFYTCNRLPLPVESHQQVRDWLETAWACGELTRDDNLFFAPWCRAKPMRELA